MQFQQCNCFHVDDGVIVMLLWNAAASKFVAREYGVARGNASTRVQIDSANHHLLSHHNSSTEYLVIVITMHLGRQLRNPSCTQCSLNTVCLCRPSCRCRPSIRYVYCL